MHKQQLTGQRKPLPESDPPDSYSAESAGTADSTRPEIQPASNLMYGIFQEMIVRTAAANGMSEDTIRLFLSEEPGPAPVPCPHCGTMLTHEKFTDDTGAFAGWCPLPNPCTNPECQALEADAKRKAAEAERRREEAKQAEEFAERVRMNLRASGVPAAYRKCTFEADPCAPQMRAYLPQNDSQAAALRIARDYADGYESMLEDGLGLYIAGPVGTGKTHLAAAIANELIRAGHGKILFVSSIDMLANIKASFGDNRQNAADVVDAYKTAKLLVIDDLGKEHHARGGWAMDVLAEILHTRDAQGRPVIVTSNYAPAALEGRLSDGDTSSAQSVVSRLKGSTTYVPVVGPDHRECA